MKTLNTIISVFFFFCLKSNADDIVLSVGGSKSIDVSTNAKIHNPNSKIIKVHDLGNKLLLSGKTAGSVHLGIDGQSVSVHVLEPAEFNAHSGLNQFLKDKQGLQLRLMNSQPTLTGVLLRFSDWKELVTLSRENNWRFRFSAKIEDHIQKKIYGLISEELTKTNLPKVSFTYGENSSAHFSKQEIAAQYGPWLQQFGIVSLINTNGIDIEPTVGVKILVTEIRKKHFRRLGIKWPNQLQVGLLPTPNIDQTQAVLTAEAIEDQGYGRVLASPHILCRSGKEANFLAGGEIPIRISGYRDSKVEWKKYGVQLQLKPRADFQGRMSIGLTTEISDIDTSQSIDGVPGFLTNRVESHFDLQKSRTIVLSGLIKKDNGNAKSGLPFISQIPILGALFSSQDYRDNETELVILVTPKIMNETDLEHSGDGSL